MKKYGFIMPLQFQCDARHSVVCYMADVQIFCSLLLVDKLSSTSISVFHACVVTVLVPFIV